jgi:hypothetical protein
MEQYTTSGEDTIWSIILHRYGVQEAIDPAKAKEIYDQVARANPHITFLETLTVGDVLNLPGAKSADTNTDAGEDTDEGATPTQQLKSANKKKPASSGDE